MTEHALIMCREPGYSFSYLEQVRAFCRIAIPQSGLLSQASSLRLPSEHSGQVLILSNAARSSLSLSCLLVGDVSVWAVAPLGVAVRHLICEFLLFIYFPSRLFCPLRFQGLPQTRWRECFLVFGNFSLFQDSLPGTNLRPYLFCLSFYLLYFVLPPCEDNGLFFWVLDVLCQQSEVLWNLLSVQMFF